MFLGILLPAFLFIGMYCYAFRGGAVVIDDYITIDRPAKIHPDYTDTIIPHNIAPLNFQVIESGERFYVKIYSTESDVIYVQSGKSSIKIPLGRWKKLLSQNRGQSLYFDIYKKDNCRWYKYETITNTIADEDIDQYLVYRKIPLCVIWYHMGTYQRDLSCFDESSVLYNSTYGNGCAHCHSFLNNNPDHMIMQVRSASFGTPMLMGLQSEIAAVNTKTKVTPGKCGFTAWHPSGKIIAFSLNKYSMLYHSAALEVRDVFDHAADLALYLVDEKKVMSTIKITNPERIETMPEWSNDGKYLYFCSAPQRVQEQHKEVLCDLMRIGFDLKTQKWGELETVLTAQSLKGSITQPRFSPDGRFLLISVSEYSDFPIHQAKSDLYLLEVETGQCSKLPISSDRNESWHGFSSNGRWIVFNSKRMDGRFARPHFSYFDKTGRAYKPFVMPQKDPTYYDSLTLAYNIPELLIKPIEVSQKQLAESIIAYKNAPDASAITGATPGVNISFGVTDPKGQQQAWPDAGVRE